MGKKTDTVVIMVPPRIRNKITQTVKLLLRAGQDYEAHVTALTTEWAFSKWLLSKNVFHEWNQTIGLGFSCESTFSCKRPFARQLIGVHVSAVYSNCGFNTADDGIRVSNHYLSKYRDVAWYVCSGYDGQRVYIAGAAQPDYIRRNADIFEIWPMIYNLPADRLQVPANEFLRWLSGSMVKGQPLGGFLDQSDVGKTGK